MAGAHAQVRLLDSSQSPVCYVSVDWIPSSCSSSGHRKIALSSQLCTKIGCCLRACLRLPGLQRLQFRAVSHHCAMASRFWFVPVSCAEASTPNQHIGTLRGETASAFSALEGREHD